MNYEILRRTAGYRLAILAILALLLAAALLAGLRFGSLRLDAAEILHTLLSEREGVKFQILWNIRLPRVLLGALVGGSLAVSGAVLQGIMRNPLASPGIIGISSGGGLGGVLVLLALPQFSHLLVPAAFAGALATAFLVYLLAWKRGIDPVRLILSGVAVGSMLGAMSSTILLFNAEKVAGILDFTVGSLSTRSWPQFRLVWPYMLSGFLVSWLASSRLNILMLGDEVAAGLGIRVERVRILLLVAAALLAAAAVSVAGLLGFVGLIAPHIVRLLIGSDNRFLVPGAALFGAALVVGCDTIGRMVMDPSELPAGVIMSLLGPPFFLYLLRRRTHAA